MKIEVVLESAAQLGTRFDIARWQLFAAFVNGQRAGGAALVPSGCRDVELLYDYADAALLWDLRVVPELRRRGIGAAILEHLLRAARETGATELRVETQQINAATCRFYAARGFRLTSARRNAYPDLPTEIQLLWSIPLTV